MITGSGFSTATGVKFGVTSATSFHVDSFTQITAVDPVEVAGTVDVTVINPYGTSVTSSADEFAYEAGADRHRRQPGNRAHDGGTAVAISAAMAYDPVSAGVGSFHIVAAYRGKMCSPFGHGRRQAPGQGGFEHRSQPVRHGADLRR